MRFNYTSLGAMMKEYNVVFLHNIVLPMLSYSILKPNLLFLSIFLIVLDLAYLGTYELGLEMTVYLPCRLRGSSSLFHEP
jgi:hypothetical protein